MIKKAERNRESRLRREIQAIEELTKIRKRLQEEYGVWRVDLLAEAREERGSDIERVWKGEA